jgi:integrase
MEKIKKAGPGIYKYESTDRRYQGKPDICFYIRYPKPGGKNVKKTEKIGWLSEGYSPQIAEEIRADRIRSLRHEGKVKTNKEIQAHRKRLNQTVSDIATVYFQERKGDLKGYKTDLNRYQNHIKPILGSRPVDTLTELDIKRVEREMKTHAKATIANTIELLRRLTNYGAKNKLCKRPGFVIKVPKKDNAVTEYLTTEELKRLMDILDYWHTRDVVRMLKLAMFTGMRRGEIFKLEDHDLDFNFKLITIRDPKGDQTVTIPMNTIAEGIISEQLEWRDKHHQGSSVIFPGKLGGIRKDCTAVKRIKERSKLPDKFRIFHGLRHHFAVTLANSGQFQIDEIAELLTHKDPRLTKERYGQFLPETKQRLSNKAADLLMKGIDIDNSEKDRNNNVSKKAE